MIEIAGSFYQDKPLMGHVIEDQGHVIEDHYEYCILLEHMLYKEAYEWCEKILPKNDKDHWTEQRWVVIYPKLISNFLTFTKLDYYSFYFKTSEDSLLFALRWA